MNAATEAPAPAVEDRRAAWAAAFVLAAAAVFYIVRGMPWAHEDDLAFVGTGIDLVRTGQLANHTMNGWLAEFGTDRFYIQLPFGVYSLALWIRLFGVSTRGFLIFEWGWYLVGCVGLVRLLGRFGVPWGMRLLLATAYLTLLVGTGLRPDSEAFGLTFLGLSLLDGASSAGRKIAALLLLGFGLTTYPMSVAVALPFALAVCWLERASPGAAVRASVWPLALAVAIVVATFLAMIHLDVRAFAAVFLAHRRSRVLADGNVAGFVRLMTEYWQTVLILPVCLLLVGALVFVAVRGRSVERPLRVLIGALAAAALGCVFVYAARAPAWVLLLAYGAGGALVTGQAFRRYRWRLAIACTAMYLWSQSLWIVNATCRRFPDPATLRAAREVAQHAGKELVVDSSAARYVFNFQLPEHTRDFVFFKPQQRVYPMTPADKKDAACWVISAPVLDAFSSGMPERLIRYQRLTIGHHEFKSIPLRPDDPVVIP